MKRYLYVASAESVHGTQTFYIDAESQRHANVRAAQGDTDGIYEEILEVQGLGDFEPCGDTHISDFGDFPPDALSLNALTARVAELEKDAKRWQAFRNRDEYGRINFVDFTNKFRHDADRVVDDALLVKGDRCPP